MGFFKKKLRAKYLVQSDKTNEVHMFESENSAKNFYHEMNRLGEHPIFLIDEIGDLSQLREISST
jgi:hypothetical protein